MTSTPCPPEEAFSLARANLEGNDLESGYAMAFGALQADYHSLWSAMLNERCYRQAVKDACLSPRELYLAAEIESRPQREFDYVAQIACQRDRYMQEYTKLWGTLFGPWDGRQSDTSRDGEE